MTKKTTKRKVTKRGATAPLLDQWEKNIIIFALDALNWESDPAKKKKWARNLIAKVQAL